MWSIELFAGAGGLALGVSRSGLTPAVIVEWDKWCCDTIRENQDRLVDPVLHWPRPVEGDVRAVKFHKFRGQIELVAGGPPCQPFSLGGKHRASDDDRDMWPEVVRVIRETAPKAFIFENVKGLVRASFTPYRNYIHLQLQHPGLRRKKEERWEHHLARLQKHHTSHAPDYNVLPPEVLNSADYGIPQRRERVFFVGFRNDLGVHWRFPTPTHSRENLLHSKWITSEYWDKYAVPRKLRGERPVDPRACHDHSIDSVLYPWRTVRDAIHDLPDPEHYPRTAAEFLNHKFQPGARSYPGHTGSPMDEPAKTLKAGVHGVPGGENMLVRPDGSLRYFSVRECARLQTFPDTFAFHGSWSETMRQLGNAVPVDLAAVIASSVTAAIRRHEEPLH